ncbi:zinc finger protein 583-like [Planococcus citri]|uniref:zinc finger protein 583-like n=1 Tax=Planococcus citri TaxID=170843 RepID=UPI0031F898A2
MNPTVNIPKSIVEQSETPKIVGVLYCPMKMYIYSCSLCEKRLHGISMYKNHMKNVHRDSSHFNRVIRTGRGPPKKTYTCVKCKKQLLGSVEYKKHLAGHDCKSFQEAVKCPVCELILQKSNLKEHLRQIHQTSLGKLRPFQCKKCTRLFLRFGNLLIHERNDHKERKQFAPQISGVNSKKEEQTACSKCGKVFSSVNWLRKHEFSAKCQATDSTAVQNSPKCQANNSNAVLNRPECQASNSNVVRKRSKNGAFKCSYCDSRFTAKFNVYRHERKAHGKHISLKKRKRRKREVSTDLESTKKYTEGVNQSNSVPKHHTPGGVKMIYADDLFCSYCPNFFANVYSKQLHEKIHTGEWSYKCKDCEMVFRLPRTCSDHEMKCGDMHDMIWCHFCDYCTKVRTNLELHYQNTHEFDLNEYESFLQKENHSSDALQNDAAGKQSPVFIKEEPDERMDDDDEALWSEFIVIDD